MDDLAEKMAIAIRDEIKKFVAPADYYISIEATRRYDSEHGVDAHHETISDLEFESYLILARAALKAIGKGDK